MKNGTSRLTPVALAIALGLASTTLVVFAQSTTTSDEPATVVSDNMIQPISDDGYQAMRMVRRARLAIFNGDTQVAKDSLAWAQSSLETVAQAKPMALTESKQGVDGKIVREMETLAPATAVAIDSDVILSDDFVVTPARQAHVAKANQHLTKGNAKAAAQELRLADVEASFTHVMMPIAATTAAVGNAGKLVDEGKFYEANLALKTAEDGLTIETVSWIDVPGNTPTAEAAKSGTAKVTAAANATLSTKATEAAKTMVPAKGKDG